MEISFERGGTLPNRKAIKKRDDDFGARNVETDKSKQKQQSSKRERIKKAKGDINGTEAQEINSAKPLTLNSLAPDQILMGIIKAAYSSHLHVNLPGRLVGKVPITHISRSYSKLMQTVLENQDLTMKPKTLAELFTPGQIVYVKVVDKCHGEKQEILLSLLPEDINSEVGSGIWAEGNILMCAVTEEEDHGYLMESGVKGFKAFLPKKNLKVEPSIGELFFCKIQKITTAVMTLSAFKKTEMLKIDTADVPNMKTLLPGCVINFSIARVLKNGIEGLIFDGSISAYANEMYLPAKISMNDNEIIGKEVRARILYTVPLSNQLFVTLIVDEAAGKPKKKLEYGTLIETAKVVKQTSSGIILKLNANSVGFLPRRVIVKHLKSNFDIDSALIKYSPNSTHVVRVMDYNAFENCYLCTNDEKLVHEKFFGTFDLEIGQIVQAKVEEKLSDGFRLTIGNVRAFLRGILLNKSPKIVVGDEIKVRIAEIDHDAKFVQTTNLLGFLREASQTLNSKKGIKSGESYAGVVLNENLKFYTILFFNHIKGHLAKTPESEADIIGLGGLKIGAVKNFEVKNFKSDRITLSVPRKMDTQNLGKIFECKVTAVLPSGLQVFINDLKVYGKVPINFLSEIPTISTNIHSNIKENDKFEVVALVNNHYSRRDVEYYKNGPVIDFNKVNPGDVLRCYVKTIDSDTIELECPLKNFNQTIKLNRNAFDNPDNVALQPDDIVYVSVIGKNESHRNSLYVTPALNKVWRNEADVSLQIVQSCLADNELMMSKLKASGKPFGKYTIGQRVSGTIKNIIGNNLLLEVSDKIFAQGTVDNVQSFKVGGTVKDAVIVWLDPISQMIHVTLKDKCREDVSVDQKADAKMVSEKKHKAIVVYFNDFVTVCTTRKSGQPLVYAPSKLHYNDFAPNTNRALGNANSKLVIKKLVDGKLLGTFVQDFKVFQKIEKLKTKLESSLGKRKANDIKKAESEVDGKKSKVILDVSDDDEEDRNTETEGEEEKPKTLSVPVKFNESLKSKGKKFGKSMKGAFKKSAMKLPMKKRNFKNKDSMMDEKLVNLVSFKSMKEGETAEVKKPARIIRKSTIGKKVKPKRLVKKK